MRSQRSSPMGALGSEGMRRSVFIFCAALVVHMQLQEAGAVETGRFKYGAIYWKRSDSSSRRVTITVESAWKLSNPAIVVFGTQDKVSKPGEMFKVVASETEDPLLKFGDGQMTARYDVTVVRVDPLLDTVLGVTEFVHDYPVLSTYDVTLTLCCRVAGTQNALRSTLLQTRLVLSGSVLGSPIFNVLPLISLDATQPGVRKFRVTAAMNGGGSVSYALGTAAQYGYRSVPPSSSIIQSIQSSTGIMSVDGTCYFAGNCTSYADLNVVVTATFGDITSTVDFIINMQRPLPGASHIPSLTLIAPPLPSPLNSLWTTGVMEMPVVEAFVGFPVQLRVRGTDADVGQSVYFAFSALPTGTSFGTLQGTNPSLQPLTWTPSEDQMGSRFLCIAAIDVDPATPCSSCPQSGVDCTPVCPPHRISEPRCFEVLVKENTTPTFVLPTITEINAYMNQQIEIEVRAVTSNWADSVTIAPYNTHPAGSSIVPIDNFVDRVKFLWRPQKNFGGWSSDVCFRATELLGKEAIQCLRINVAACMWNVGQGDTLDSIAAMLGSNYVQLWALNVEKDSPDAILQENEKVRIGHLYQVRATDNLRYLSVQFASTRETIEMLNYNTVPQGTGDKDPLASLAGTYICILPHSCASVAAQ